MTTHHLSRRNFLAGTGALIAGAPAILGAKSPNDAINIAMIGSGGRGRANLRELVKSGENINIVALCDVNEDAIDQAAKEFPKAERFADFRQLFDKLKNFDAVVVSTCEHTHAFATLRALKMGKHVYCEKPLTHVVSECRVIRDAAREAKGIATQMGTQGHASPNFRRVKEVIQAGAIGPVREVHVWVSRAWGLQSKEAHARSDDKVFVTERPEGMPVPANLHWDLWIGPAPMRPFNEVYVPGPKWYRWWDFGNGTMSDLGSHNNNLPFWTLDLDAPKTIEPLEASHMPPHPELAPASLIVKYGFGARGSMPPVDFYWYQGEYKPPQFKEGKIPQQPNGQLFVGDKGMLLTGGGDYTLLPEDKFKDFVPPPPSLPESPGHWKEWLLAARNGTPTSTPFEYAAKLTESNHLGNVAYRVGKKIEWDAEKMEITNAPEGMRFIKKEYQNGWQL